MNSTCLDAEGLQMAGPGPEHTAQGLMCACVWVSKRGRACNWSLQLAVSTRCREPGKDRENIWSRFRYWIINLLGYHTWADAATPDNGAEALEHNTHTRPEQLIQPFNWYRLNIAVILFHTHNQDSKGVNLFNSQLFKNVHETNDRLKKYNSY